jgi:hypothetical protein
MLRMITASPVANNWAVHQSVSLGVLAWAFGARAGVEPRRTAGRRTPSSPEESG